MKLDFGFVPFPREIWAQKINLSQAEFRLLGWFLWNVKYGVEQVKVTDEQLLNGIKSEQIYSSYPPLGLSRNSMQKARELLISKNILIAEQIEGGGGRGKAAKWSYLLNLSDSDKNTKPLKLCEDNTPKTSQTLIINLSDSDNVYKEEREVQRSTETPPSGSKEPGEKKSVDPRRKDFFEDLKGHWDAMNHGNPKFVMDAKDARQVDIFLKKWREITRDDWRRCLKNRRHSGNTIPTAEVYKWVTSLMDYTAGPQNEFNRIENIQQTRTSTARNPAELTRLALEGK